MLTLEVCKYHIYILNFKKVLVLGGRGVGILTPPSPANSKAEDTETIELYTVIPIVLLSVAIVLLYAWP